MQTIGGDEVALVLSQRREQVMKAGRECKNWKLDQWEDYLNAINPSFMELGLQRIGKVAERLQIQALLKQSQAKVVAVAGTNGKGSTCALIAQAMANLGFQVGLYTSPHLIRFNERIQINSQEISDQLLCETLSQVVKAQIGNHADDYIDLSYFEIITLAAFLAFLHEQCQVWVLEVGLGGRLDAVNLLEHQISVITSIGLDHMKILGDSVEKIAFEKAGIIHPQDFTILGRNIPAGALQVIKQVALERQAILSCENEQFSTKLNAEAKTASSGLNYQVSNQVSGQVSRVTDDVSKPDYSCSLELLTDLHAEPLHFGYPKVPFICAAPALQAVLQLMRLLDCNWDEHSRQAINAAVTSVALPGRMQLVHTNPAVYLDVAHNVPAAMHLKEQLKYHLSSFKRKIAVMGMLKDKDVEGVLQVLQGSFDIFYTASLHVPRGESAERLVTALQSLGCSHVLSFDTVEQALHQALQDAQSEDVLVVVGSFVTVAEAQKALQL